MRNAILIWALYFNSLAGLNKKDSEEIAGTVNQVAEADDVINFHCTEEVDEFTNFLNEFEDELKEKPLKAKDESIVTQSHLKQGENKVK